MNLLTFAHGFTQFGRFFSFSFNARLLVMLPATSFSQYTVLLNLAVETFQSCFERVIFTYFDF